MLLELRQGAGEGQPGPADPRVRGRQRHAHHRGDLLGRQTVEIVQHDGDPVPLGQQRQHRHHLPARARRLEAILADQRGILELDLVAGQLAPLAALEVIVGHAGGDPGQPGTQRTPRIVG